jgi:antitoxin component of MazEF toxin-antitoxin module
VTIPAEIMRRLDLSVGETLVLEVVDRAIVARPTRRMRPKRLTLAQLLEGVTPEGVEALNVELAQFRDAPSQGRELP